jgi:hypothetical protein
MSHFMPETPGELLQLIGKAAVYLYLIAGGVALVCDLFIRIFEDNE